jgi:hypothetical protein
VASPSLLLIVNVGEVEALCTGEPVARLPTLCLDQVGVKEVELLRQAVPWRDGYQSDRSEIVVRGSHDGRVVLRVSPVFVASLARLSGDDQPRLVASWEQSLASWDNCVQWPPHVALAKAVAQLCALARQAIAGGKEVFWQLTPEAWAERLQLEQDFNCVELNEGPLWRIRFGQEATSSAVGVPPRCPGCHTRVGLFHLSGCRGEECPKCHERLAFCLCERGVRAEDE